MTALCRRNYSLTRKEKTDAFQLYFDHIPRILSTGLVKECMLCILSESTPLLTHKEISPLSNRDVFGYSLIKFLDEFNIILY